MTGKERDLITQVEVRGNLYQVFERTRWSRRKQTLSVTYEYLREDGFLHKGKILHHYWLRDQLVAALQRASLSVVNIHGGFENQRFGKTSEQLVVRAVRT